MVFPAIHESAIAKHFEVLNKIGCLGHSPAEGFTRAAYSSDETAAMRHFEAAGLALGATIRWDAIGNLFIEFPGSGPDFVEAGSHLDTVPRGGNFDGAAGVVAGFEAIVSILSTETRRQKGLRLRIWRCEESATFNSLYTGSRGAFGELDPKFLQQRYAGLTLENAMRSQGFDPSIIQRKQPTISVGEIDNIAAHMELHIEQGVVLERAGADVGAVTSIRGPRRYRVEFHGAFDHSGATPMGPEYRRDANLALAYFLVELDCLGKRKREEGNDLVQTVGVINSEKEYNESTPEVYQNAVPKVSGFAYCSVEIRSRSDSFCAAYGTEVEKLLQEVAGSHRVRAQMSLRSSSPGLEQLDQTIQDSVMRSSSARGYRAERLASGAGHDAAIVAQQRRRDGTNVPVGMIFIPCLEGKSHCPEEFTTMSAIAKGATVLADVMRDIIGQVG